MTKISQRAQKTPPSPIRSLSRFASDAENRGVYVHKLNIGQPDVESPTEFLSALRAFDEKVISYDATNGNPTLLTEWCRVLNDAYNINVSSKNMIITTGSSEALTFAFSVCCDVGDEILVFEPTYANYAGFAALSGVSLVTAPCAFSTGYHLPDRRDILQKISSKTKAILVCNPNNPTGTVLTTDELTMLVNICEERDLFLIVDEVYREFVYTNDGAMSVFQIAPKHEKIIVVDSVSKRYSLCGARVGCLVSFNDVVMNAASVLASTRVAAPTIEQVATAHMLRNTPQQYLINAINEYRQRRDVIVSELMNIKGVHVNEAEGGFYVLAELPVSDATAFCTFLLRDFSHNNETVFLAPATNFYITPESGKNAVRIAFVTSVEESKRAIDIIRRALEVYTAIAAA